MVYTSEEMICDFYCRIQIQVVIALVLHVFRVYHTADVRFNSAFFFAIAMRRKTINISVACQKFIMNEFFGFFRET